MLALVTRIWQANANSKCNSGAVDIVSDFKPYFQLGVIYCRSETKFPHIVDGTSNTYLIGEMLMSTRAHEDVNAGAKWEQYDDNQSAFVGFEWDNHRIAWAPFQMYASTPNAYQPQQDRLGDGTDFCLWQRAHSGGLNRAMCDGLVDFVEYDIDQATHRSRAVRYDDGNRQ